MLKWEYKKSHKTALDSRVCWAVVNTCRLWDFMDDLARLFPLAMSNIKSGNHMKTEHSYKLNVNPASTEAELWHHAADGTPDRHLMTIRFISSDNDLI